MKDLVEIGSRLELFVDDWLVERLRGAERVLHHPTPQNVALRFDRPWEGNVPGHFTVLQEPGLFRMYYRGANHIYGPEEREGHQRVVCVAESADGIEWNRPSLGLVEFAGSTDNNIILKGPGTDNFVPFQDGNPEAAPDARYKAVGRGRRGMERGLYAWKSADGLSWTLMADRPVVTDGAFDSQNLAFWDAVRGEYREYHRDFRPGRDPRGNKNGRDIKTAASRDFLDWPDPVWLSYSPGRTSELYTNQVNPYYRAPHLYLGFPTRYVDRGWTESTRALPHPEYRRFRATNSEREGTAVTDGMLMSSRDGLNFDVWPESFNRPGLRTSGNWLYGDNYQSLGLIETRSAIEGAPDELSFFVTEATNLADVEARSRRYTIRIDGFVSVNAGLEGGELVTRPLVFDGDRLVLNFSSSAAGVIWVELQDANGQPVDGRRLEDCDEVWGDDLARTVSWRGDRDVGGLAGQPVRLRFRVRDADLYSLRFARRETG